MVRRRGSTREGIYTVSAAQMRSYGGFKRFMRSDGDEGSGWEEIVWLSSQIQSCGGTVQSSSRTCIGPKEGDKFLFMFLARTVEITGEISVARTSQPRELKARL
jgi:hypothetical protein